MSKKLFKKYIPHSDVITGNRWIKKLGPRLQEPSLWHINRRSCAGGLAVGLFFAFVPMPFQMLLAAVAAIIFKVNILIAVPVVWISNPITMPVIFYFCYRLGAEILQIEVGEFHFELSWQWLANGLGAIWQPFLLGCLVASVVSSFLGFVLVRVMWRYHIWSHLKIRQSRKLKFLSKKNNP
ncbi:MAG: hypothetical protein ACI845_003213 [Gammaproteobacteria bacterium]|jgi:uncharacterized protein (DUF2062 family)